MNGLDIAIALSALAAFVGGYRTGLLARIAGWTGAFLGLLLVAKYLGTLFDRFRPGITRRPFEVLAVLVAATVCGRLVGTLFGRWIQHRLPTRPVRTANRLAGGGVGLVCVAAMVWLITPLLAFVPGWPAGAARGSIVATRITEAIPVRPGIVRSVRRLLANGRLPQAIPNLDRAVDGSGPPENTMSDVLQNRVAKSVVLVSSIGCGVESDGTGFVLSAHRILTNAHVVAGGREISVHQDVDVDVRKAVVVAFDPSRDLAVLEVSEGLRSILQLSDESDQEVAGPLAVFGHPGAGPLRIAPASLIEKATSAGRDIYDRRESKRKLLVLAAELGPGDSGAPIVEQRTGTVVGIAFAIAPDRSSTAYALDAREIRDFLGTVEAESKGRPSNTSSGHCLR